MKTVLLLLANGIEPMEMSAFTDVLGWATLAGEEKIKFIDARLRSEIVTTFGLKLSPNHLLRNINLNEFDALAIPGGFEFSGFYDEALSEEYLDVIRHFHVEKKIIASICVASLVGI